jgi:hypothetical protein
VVDEVGMMPFCFRIGSWWNQVRSISLRPPAFLGE